jgi:hypothetical protein
MQARVPGKHRKRDARATGIQVGAGGLIHRLPRRCGCRLVQWKEGAPRFGVAGALSFCFGKWCRWHFGIERELARRFVCGARRGRLAHGKKAGYQIHSSWDPVAFRQSKVAVCLNSHICFNLPSFQLPSLAPTRLPFRCVLSDARMQNYSLECRACSFCL